MSTTEESSALAVRESSGASIVKRVPIPAELQELGVRIAEEEGTGLRVIVLPPAVRNAVNLITPVSSFAQADPNWTPAISLVQLDLEMHTYPLPGGKKGLNKQALETLGKTAGVLYTRTTRVPKEELQEGEMWAYRATVGFRKSDGTIDEVTRERGFNREAETMEIEDSVARNNPRGTEAFTVEVRKRWIAELRFGPSKTESKAINRALRAGLQMPASITAAMLQKPFLVVGFNFTPDYNDPEIKRGIFALASNAQQAIYGQTATMGELEPATPRDGAEDVDGSDLERSDVPQLGAGSPADEAGSQTAGDESVSDVDDEQAGHGEAEEGDRETHAAARTNDDDPAAVPGSSDEPSLDDEEPSRPAIRIPEAAIEAAGRVIAKGEVTVAEIVARGVDGDARAVKWLGWAKRSLEDAERRGALELYATQRAAALWTSLDETPAA